MQTIVVMMTLWGAALAASGQTPKDTNAPFAASYSHEAVERLRKAAEDQRTNALAWLQYGIAVKKVALEKLIACGPSTNVFDESISAYEQGLAHFPNNSHLLEGIASAYQDRAEIKLVAYHDQLRRDGTSKKDSTIDGDLEKALHYYSQSLSNAAGRIFKKMAEDRIVSIKNVMSREQAFENNLKLLREGGNAASSNASLQSGGSSVNSSNQFELTQLRNAAENQRTNASAWMQYGYAALGMARRMAEQKEKADKVACTNAFVEAINAFQEGLKNAKRDSRFIFHDVIADTYGDFAFYRIQERDPTWHEDFEKAIYHASLAVSNAPAGEAKSTEFRLSVIQKRYEQAREFDAAMKQLEEKKERSKNKTPEEWRRETIEKARKRAVEDEPNNPVALVDYALILFDWEYTRLGHTNVLADVRETVEKAIVLNEHQARAYWVLGQWYEQQGDRENALLNYERALKEEPESGLYRLFVRKLKPIPSVSGKDDGQHQ